MIDADWLLPAVVALVAIGFVLNAHVAFRNRRAMRAGREAHFDRMGAMLARRLDADADHPEPSEATVMPAEPKSETRTTTEERAKIYCITCGCVWNDHTEACSRHAYRPGASGPSAPPEPDDIARARRFVADVRAMGFEWARTLEVGRMRRDHGTHPAGSVVIVSDVRGGTCTIERYEPMTETDIRRRVPLDAVDLYPASDPGTAELPSLWPASGANGRAHR